MQHLVVQTSKPAHLNANDWVTNGVGRKGTSMPGMERGLPLPGCWGRASRCAQAHVPPGDPRSSADPVSVLSVCSQPLLWLRPAGRWGHGQPGQELDHSGTSEEMCYRCPHGAQVRAGEPRGASPRICPVRGPMLEPGHLWGWGWEWGGSVGLSCSRHPRPSTSESLGRAGKGTFSQHQCRPLRLPAAAGAGLGCCGLGAASATHPQTEGLFRAGQKLLLLCLAVAAAMQCVPSLVCGQTLPGALRGVSLGMEGARAGPCPSHRDQPCPSL